jgi:ABC-type nitrate/sulfonate/bicarbonate transport system substrate-binding protein
MKSQASAFLKPGCIPSLLACIIFAVGTGNARAAEKLETPDIELLAVQDPNIGGQAAVAEGLGLFKDEGLNVTIHWTQSTGDVITIMASGNQNLATGGSQTEVILAAQ